MVVFNVAKFLRFSEILEEDLETLDNLIFEKTKKITCIFTRL